MRILDTYPTNINGWLLCKLEEAKVTMVDELIDTKMNFWTELQPNACVKIPILHPRTWALDLIDGHVISVDHTSVILCGSWAI
jgi:hypothetical protein